MSRVVYVEPGEEVESGETVFKAYHAPAIRLRRISVDTVQILFVGDVLDSTDEVEGIHLTYGTERTWFDSAKKAQNWQNLDSFRERHVPRPDVD